jgi:hypothetical protein
MGRDRQVEQVGGQDRVTVLIDHRLVVHRRTRL